MEEHYGANTPVLPGNQNKVIDGSGIGDVRGTEEADSFL